MEHGFRIQNGFLINHQTFAVELLKIAKYFLQRYITKNGRQMAKVEKVRDEI
jgi:hypothetical protein